MAAVRSSVTIRDVARVANVHPGTVSRALNEETRALVNQETAERVLRAAEQLGYRPNRIARGLKTNRSYTVGVLIPDITNPLFPPILRGIEDRLDEAGYTSLIVNTDNDRERERSHLEAMRARQVDGFISATARLDRELLADVAAGGTPLVLVNRSLEDGSVPAVTVNDRQGIRLAVEHVAALGHAPDRTCRGPAEHIHRASSPPRFRRGDARRGAARPEGAMSVSADGSPRRKAHGCAPSCSTRRPTSPRSSPVTTCSRSAATTRSSRAVCAAQTDLSIVGFNDMPFVDRLRPPLTSVRVPQREIGTVAADMLLQLLADGAQPAREILLEPTLITRGSTAAPRPS